MIDAAFRLVLPGTGKQFLHPLPNRWLPGLGPKTSARLSSAGLAETRHITATPVELFTQTYKSYGLATVRHPVLEIHARVEPHENGRGCSLRVLRAGKPRTH